MKRYLLSLVFVLLVFGVLQAQQIAKDDFESYQVGLFDGQFDPMSWTGWFGNISNAVVSTDQAFSGTQSLKIFDDTGKETDIVALLGTMSTGVDSISFMQYIDGTGSGAYYNLQHNYTNTMGDWAAEVYFGSSPAAAYIQTDGQQYNFTPTIDAWVEQKFIFDFPNSIGEFYYGGVLIHTWALNTNAAGGAGLNTINGINLYAHDNGAGNNSLAYYDDISVLTPPGIDVELTSFTNPSTYTQLTADHITPMTFSAEVTNVDGVNVTSVAVTFDVVDQSGVNVFTETVTQSALAAGASNTFTATNTFMPIPSESYSVDYSVTIAETDKDLSNNTIALNNILTITDSTFAKDDGNAIGGAGVDDISGAGAGQIGHIFDFQVQDSISSVGVSFLQTNSAAIGEQLTVHIYNTLNGMPNGTPIATSAPYTIDTSSSIMEHIFTFGSSVAVDSGQYFIAIEEATNSAAIAYSNHIFTPNTGFFTTDGGVTWNSFTSVNFINTLFIRPNVTGIDTTSTVSTNPLEAFDGNFEIHPNPTTGITTLNVEMENAQDISVTIFDVTGKLVQSFNKANVMNEKYTIDLSQQSNGIYLIRLMTNGQTITKRVVLNK